MNISFQNNLSFSPRTNELILGEIPELFQSKDVILPVQEFLL